MLGTPAQAPADIPSVETGVAFYPAATQGWGTIAQGLPSDIPGVEDIFEVPQDLYRSPQVRFGTVTRSNGKQKHVFKVMSKNAAPSGDGGSSEGDWMSYMTEGSHLDSSITTPPGTPLGSGASRKGGTESQKQKIRLLGGEVSEGGQQPESGSACFEDYSESGSSISTPPSSGGQLCGAPILSGGANEMVTEEGPRLRGGPPWRRQHRSRNAFGSSCGVGLERMTSMPEAEDAPQEFIP